MEAGIDCIEHYEFVEMNYDRKLDSAIADQMIANDIWLSPTIQTGFRKMESMLALQEERTLTPAEQEALVYFQWKQEGQLYVTGALYEMGARRFLMGTDAISQFGDYAVGLRLMAESGLPNEEVLYAATRNPAAAMGILDDVGTLETGKIADVTIVKGDPISDIRAVENVQQVVKAGYVLPMDSLELFPEGEGAVKPPVVRKPPNPRVVRLPHHHPHPHPH